MLSAGLAVVMVIVIGCLFGKSLTRVSFQFFSSIENGNSWHHPWLITVRRKLKLEGVGMVIRVGICQHDPCSEYWEFSQKSACMVQVRSRCFLTHISPETRLNPLEKTVCGRLTLLSLTLRIRGERSQTLDFLQYSGERTHRFRKQVSWSFPAWFVAPQGS